LAGGEFGQHAAGSVPVGACEGKGWESLIGSGVEDSAPAIPAAPPERAPYPPTTQRCALGSRGKTGSMIPIGNSACFQGCVD
jgi:hypothetical protein